VGTVGSKRDPSTAGGVDIDSDDEHQKMARGQGSNRKTRGGEDDAMN